MQIELIGCTSAGKSTLVRGILQAGREQGIDILTNDDFVLNLVWLNWVKNKLARTLCMDLIALFACLITWRDIIEFYLFAIRIILRLPPSVAWFEKLNIARNVLKMVGVYEIVLHCGSDQQIVLADEGTLHTAHYLFVHVSVEPNINDISTFVKLVPLPDMVIYVQQDEDILIERTLARKHKRIPDGSHAQVELFIKRATSTFDKLAQHSVVKSRLVVVDSQRNIIIAKDDQNDPLLAKALEIIRAGIDAVGVYNSTRIVPTQGAKMPKRH